MKNMQKSKTRQLVLGFILIGTVGVGFWLVARILYEKFSNLWVQASAEYKLAFIAALFSVFGIIYTQIATKRREINARHFSEKAEAYKGFSETLFDLFFSEKATGKKLPGDELLNRIIKFKKDIFIWGGHRTLKAWKEFELSSGQADFKENAEKIGKLIKEMRRDLGHKVFLTTNLEHVQFLLNKEAIDQLNAEENNKTK